MIPKLAFSLIFLTIILLVFISPPFEFNPRKICESATNSFKITFSNPNHPDIDKSTHSGTDQEEEVTSMENCDLFSGEWIPNPEGGPYYTNETCYYNVQLHQNCMKYGKPDGGYSKWRWKPDSCELPIFNPNQFSELIRGKSIAFLGDSVARNYMQSLLCLLSEVVVPEDVSSPEWKESQEWVFKDYNFNISLYWSPFLIRAGENNYPLPTNIYLDEFDERWTSIIAKNHYIIISAGSWFYRPFKLYENRRLFACYKCDEYNVAKIDNYVAFQKAFQTTWKAINSLARSEAIIFLITFSPTHYEAGKWDSGRDCVRTRPFKRNQTVLEPTYSIMREMQLVEFQAAQEENKRGLRIRLLDVTKSMLLRPDGHSGKYGQSIKSRKNKRSDCLHWCLPGPLDMWSDLLLQLLLREEPVTLKN